MAISHWPENERPREKLLYQGAGTLSDAELLSIFLRTGVAGLSAVELANRLLTEFGGLRELMKADAEEFCGHKGLGVAKYSQLQATLEMSRRHLAASFSRGEQLSNTADTANFLLSKLRDEPHEVFAVLFLDSKHRILGFEPLFFGTIDSAAIHPRVLIRKVLEENAAAVILAHNHPSGLAEPSRADKAVTKTIVEALKLIEVKVLDHIVIGDGETVSFAERGWL